MERWNGTWTKKNVLVGALSEDNWSNGKTVIRKIMKLDDCSILSKYGRQTTKSWGRLIPNIWLDVNIRRSYWQHRKRLLSSNCMKEESENQAQNLIIRETELKRRLNSQPPLVYFTKINFQSWAFIFKLIDRKRNHVLVRKELQYHRARIEEWVFQSEGNNTLSLCVTTYWGKGNNQMFWELLAKGSMLTLRANDLKHHRGPC